MADERILITITFESNAAQALKKVRDTVSRTTGDVNKRVGLATKSFRFFGRSIVDAGRSVGSFARRWTALAGTLAATAAVFKSVSDAQKFGIAVAEIGTIFEGTDSQLARIEGRFLELAETLGLPEQLVAKGFYQIISSDITDAAEATLLLEESSKLATVGLADVKVTTDLLTSVIKAYQRDVSDAAEISNVLFKTVIKGKTTIPELATSMGQVLPVAAALNISLEEVSAAVATITQGGIQTNTAVIQLRQAMNQLLKPSVEAQKVFAKYGLDISAARVQTDGFVTVLGELQKELGGNASAMSRVFGNIRGLLPILALTGKQAAQFARNLEFISDGSQKVEGALGRLLRNPFKQFQRFFNSLRIRLRSVGEVFIRELSNALGARDGLDSVVEKFDVMFEALRGGAKVAAEAIGQLIDHVSNFLKRLGGAENAANVLRKAGEALGNVINVGFQLVLTVISAVAEAIIRLPQIVTSAINDILRAVNKASGGLVGSFIPTAEDVKKEIDAIILERKRLFLEKGQVQGGNIPKRLLNIGTIAAVGGDLQPPVRNAQEALERLDKEIALNEEQFFELRAELDRAPESFDALSMSINDMVKGVLTPGSESMLNMADALAALHSALDQPAVASPLLGTLDELSDLEDLATIAMSSIADVGENINLEAALAAAQVQANFQEILQLASDLRVKVTSPEGLAQFIVGQITGDLEAMTNAIASAMSEQLNVGISKNITAESLSLFRESAAELAAIRADVVEGLGASVGADQQLAVLEAVNNAERASLRTKLQEISATEEQIALIIELFDLLVDKNQKEVSGGFGEGFSDGLERAREELDNTAQRGAEAAFTLVIGTRDAMADMFSDIITGAATAQEAFKAFADSILKALADIAAAEAASAIVGSLGFAVGGITPGPVTAMRSFAKGGITGPIEKLGAGGVKVQRTVAEIAEAGKPEAVVPLPGFGRGIPVEFKGAAPSAAPSQQNVQANITFSFQNLDPRGTEEAVLTQVPKIQRMIASALSQGSDRQLDMAIKGVARGA